MEPGIGRRLLESPAPPIAGRGRGGGDPGGGGRSRGTESRASRARLLRLVFEVDPLTCRGGAEMKVISAPGLVQQLLRHVQDRAGDEAFDARALPAPPAAHADRTEPHPETRPKRRARGGSVRRGLDSGGFRRCAGRGPELIPPARLPSLATTLVPGLPGRANHRNGTNAFSPGTPALPAPWPSSWRTSAWRPPTSSGRGNSSSRGLPPAGAAALEPSADPASR